MNGQTQNNSKSLLIPRNLRWVALAGAFMAMGFSMPSCPGQQAMQQQIDALQAGQTDATKKTQALDSQIKTMGQEMAQMKQLVEQMANTVQAQKGAIEQLNNSLKEMDTKLTAATAKPAAASKSSSKKRH